MNRRLLYVVVVCLLVGGNLVFAAEGASPADTVIEFYNASQDGDIGTMKQLIAGSFYNTRKVLLEENQEYGGFLRQHYQGIKVQIVNSVVKKDNTTAAVHVKIEFPDGGIDTAKLLLKKGADGTWKIVEELNP